VNEPIICLIILLGAKIHQMFERIKRYFLDTRIRLDFPRFERQCYNEHEQQAQIRFSTQQFEDEKKKLLAKIELQANSKFDALLHEKEVERRKHQAEACDTDSLLSFFLRHYKQELDELYAEKDALFSRKAKLFEEESEIKESLSEAFEEKDKAYSKINYYKERIDSWYAKSDRTPWLFGNAGKKLPKRSLFGQSFGDLDSYKYDRDSAYDDVCEAKSRIGDLKQNQYELHAEIEKVKMTIGELFGRINQVKKDRSKMYDLKKSGHNKKDLQSKFNGLRLEINRLSSELDEIVERKQEYVNKEKSRYGVKELEAKIKVIEHNKRQFLDSFNNEEKKQERKRLHREIWLKQKGYF